MSQAPLPRLSAVNLGAFSSSQESQYDALLVLLPADAFPKDSAPAKTTFLAELKTSHASIATKLEQLHVSDKAFAKDVSFSLLEPAGDGALARALVVAPIGTLDRDGDDARRYADAASRAIKRLRQAGAKNFRRPLLLVPEPVVDASVTDPLQNYSRHVEVAILGALRELHDSLHVREGADYATEEKIEALGVAATGAGASATVVEDAIAFASAVEEGRRLARDVGGSDPERMTALRAAKHISQFFENSPVTCQLATDPTELEREYPCLMAVARASMTVPRHQPCVVTLQYRSPEPSAVEEHLFFIGKGVTYDTGGADLKTGGNMVGMSRDKCGAAAVAGFLATVARLRPRHLNITARLAFVRNSIGPDAYVADEIIKSRAGVRIRIGNTDAEGRMAMCDLIAQAKEEVLASGLEEQARLFTIATLTGHAARTYGPYTAALDNTAARRLGISARLFSASQSIAEPFEMSTLRREDFKIIAATDPEEDCLQANRHPSVATSRGHQYPMAFMITAAGLTHPKKGTNIVSSPVDANFFRGREGPVKDRIHPSGHCRVGRGFRDRLIGPSYRRAHIVPFCGLSAAPCRMQACLNVCAAIKYCPTELMLDK